MSDVNEETIKILVSLSRISCTEEEQKSLLENLDKILSYIKLLDEIDTTNVPPCNQVIAGAANVMREDEIGETLPRELFLENAPAKIGGLIRVPPVIKQTSK